MAKADVKVKKLRASLGDYDAGEVEHHKVLKTIFSLAKRLLNLCGEEASKEFIKDFTKITKQHKRNVSQSM